MTSSGAAVVDFSTFDGAYSNRFFSLLGTGRLIFGGALGRLYMEAVALDDRTLGIISGLAS